MASQIRFTISFYISVYKLEIAYSTNQTQFYKSGKTTQNPVGIFRFFFVTAYLHVFMQQSSIKTQLKITLNVVFHKKKLLWAKLS